jgi:hypothetical protein
MLREKLSFNIAKHFWDILFCGTEVIDSHSDLDTEIDNLNDGGHKTNYISHDRGLFHGHW